MLSLGLICVVSCEFSLVGRRWVESVVECSLRVGCCAHNQPYYCRQMLYQRITRPTQANVWKAITKLKFTQLINGAYSNSNCIKQQREFILSGWICVSMLVRSWLTRLNQRSIECRDWVAAYYLCYVCTYVRCTCKPREVMCSRVVFHGYANQLFNKWEVCEMKLVKARTYVCI